MPCIVDLLIGMHGEARAFGMYLKNDKILLCAVGFPNMWQLAEGDLGPDGQVH